MFKNLKQLKVAALMLLLISCISFAAINSNQKVLAAEPTKLGTTTIYFNDAIDVLSWDSVPNASSYKWNVNNGEWATITATNINVESVVTAIKNQETKIANFKVVAVSNNANYLDSDASILEIDLTNEISTTIYDITSYMPKVDTSALASPFGKVKPPSSAESSKQFSANDTFKLSFSFDVVDSNNMTFFILPVSTNDALRPLFIIRPASDAAGTKPGFIRFGTASPYKDYTLPEVLNANQKYTVTFGLYEVKNNTTEGESVHIVINLFTLNTDGTERHIHSHTQNFLTTEISYVETNASVNVYKISVAQLSWMSSSVSRTYSIKVFDGISRVKTFDVDSFKPYDLTDIELQAPLGKKFNAWYYVVGDEKKYIEESGLWLYDIQGNEGVYQANVYAEYVNIDYDITYILGEKVTNVAENATQYNVDTNLAFKKPQVSSGFVFQGWYLDEEYTKPITTTNGLTEDLTIYAKIVEGYKISVDLTVETLNYEVLKSDSFTLPIKTIEGYHFDKWLYLSNDTYVEYTGESTFVPNADTNFKASYLLSTYNITYVTDEGTNSDSNVVSYTIENNHVFSPAEKENFFFEGWYLDKEFSNKITSTNGLKSDITIYAKYIKFDLPESLLIYVSYENFILPMPVLPDNSTYSIELYKESNPDVKLDLINDNEYVFSALDNYIIAYTINANNKTVSKDIKLSVNNLPVISIAGEYKTVYNVGDKLSILKANINGSEDRVSLIVKANGILVNTKDVNEINLSQGIYELIYTDNDNISDDKVFYIRVTGVVQSNNNTLATILWISAGAVVAFALGIFIVKKYKK